jgi:ABC-type phosphate transport system permease subunit
LLSVYEIWGKKGLVQIGVFVALALFVVSGVTILLGIAAGIEYLKKYFNNNRNSPIVSFGTVLVEQTKSIHDKVCPIVTFE